MTRDEKKDKSHALWPPLFRNHLTRSGNLDISGSSMLVSAFASSMGVAQATQDSKEATETNRLGTRILNDDTYGDMGSKEVCVGMPRRDGAYFIERYSARS